MDAVSQAQPDAAFLRLACQTAVAAARDGGCAALAARQHPLDMRHKGPRDLVTSGDLAAQEAVMRTLGATFPGHDIVSEEGNRAGDGSDGHGFRWVVDPVDGTTNYYRGLPFFSVSVALVRDEELLVGVVCDPSRGEVFSAVRGQGACLDGRRIQVAGTATLEEAIFGLGSP